MQKKKPVFYTELAYIAGIITLAVGTAFMAQADFGVSMVVAPAYIVYLKLSEFFPFFTFGMAEYLLQAILLISMMLVLRSFKVRYLFAFVTTIVYGLILDASMLLVPSVSGNFVLRLVYYIVGMLLTSQGVAFMFRTYISPAVYELFVKEISTKFGFNITKCKTIYDGTSCVVGIILSFCFFGFGHFEGIKLGTVICALTNALLIGMHTRILNHLFEFRDKFRKSE